MSDNYHPATWLVWTLAAATVAVMTTNPLYVTLLALAAGVNYVAIGQRSPLAQSWGAFLKLGMLIWAVTIPLNALMVHTGRYILFTLPAGWPLIGGKITLEGVAYGLVKGLDLIVVLIVFAAFNSAVDQARLLRRMPAFLYLVSMVASIALAFAFIAALGTQGIITKVLGLAGVSVTESGFSLSEFWGLVLVYLYFQIPLMFLVMMPAVGGLRRTWAEAASIMGASSARYWRSVALPLLVPAFLGGLLLLFVNAFAAYATAYVLNPGAQIVPLQIRFLLQGNVITGEQDLAYAIVLWTITILLASLILVALLQRRTAKWASA